jgi:lycopene beta-cyclase
MTPHLPASQDRRRAGDRIQRIGTAAGEVRAGSGYGFATMQRRAEARARALARQAPAAPPPALGPAWSRTDRAMDAVLLAVLWKSPQRAASLFPALYDRVDSDVLIRFLDGVARPSDRTAVIQAMPPGPFLRAAMTLGGTHVRTIVTRLGRRAGHA